MRKSFVFDYSASLETLDLRLSPSSLLPASGHTLLAHYNTVTQDDEPLPLPEPSPGVNPGTSTPITPPPLAPAGPVGPGTT